MNAFPLAPDEARRLILERIAPLPTEILPHEAVLGRVLARDVVSPFDLPPFDNSAMDGYAVRAEDAQNAPFSLQNLEIIGAGSVATQKVVAGTCLKIMTGAPLPEGAEAVIMREETRENGETVEFLAPAKLGQNVRKRGSDVARGETVLEAGTVVGAAQWAMLAALGQAQIEVFQKPKIAIVTTGDELVSVEKSLLPGQIYNSNVFSLRAMAQRAGADVVAVRHVGDGLEELEMVLREVAPMADAIVTSGGVSAGDFDPVRDVLQAQAEIHFWKVAMKPGKPVMFATFQNTPIFGLPGNPASVMVSFEEFVRPALWKMGGRSYLTRMEVWARLNSDLRSIEGRTEFVRARVETDANGFLAFASEDQGSGRLSTLTRANALLEIAAQTTFLAAGSAVRAKLLAD